jgi:DNA modification methylase/superfamily II DNA or RNA helicase
MNTQTYDDLLAARHKTVPDIGKLIELGDINPKLFPHQRDVVRWSVRKGRSAMFLSTGLGKTFCALEWARQTGERTLIVAPLTITAQFVRESHKLGWDVGTLVYARSEQETNGAQFVITNYDMVQHFNADNYGAVVIDESSSLKSVTSAIRVLLTEMFAQTKYRLCCTATPAPNDIVEIANHAEFLGIMTINEMKAMFFVNDGELGWRLKGHAKQHFYRWLASWGIAMRKPSDLGYDDTGYDLPELTVQPMFVEADLPNIEGSLFGAHKGHGLKHDAQTRRATLQPRLEASLTLINETWAGEQVIVWCGLNDESDAMAQALGASCVNVQGSDTPTKKETDLTSFMAGEARVLVSKPSIAGFGLNMQNVSKQIFLGLSHSWEQYFQAIRRSWRFGQTKPVDVRIILSTAERHIYENILRKEKEAEHMTTELINNVAEYEKAEMGASLAEQRPYETADTHGDGYHLMLGDSVVRWKELADDSIDMMVFSPPFLDLYTYSGLDRDMGNALGTDDFHAQFSLLIKELYRTIKPGRNVCVHVQNVPTTLGKHGYIGLIDFRGQVINNFVNNGFIYYGEVTNQRNPQVQAVRTKAKGLMFVQKNKDAAYSRQALADYLITFKKPGDNQTPICNPISNEEWITYAHPVWFDIKETYTLNTGEGKAEDDERHVCPLQIGIIERLIKLYSNPGELVATPFLGIGSESYVALKLGRRTVGCELKKEYFLTACRNVERVLQLNDQGNLFGDPNVDVLFDVPDDDLVVADNGMESLFDVA